MGVPNTETFSLLDVVNEIGLTGDDRNLQACFNNANASGFDSAYNNDTYAPANSMLRFRNYQHAIGFFRIVGTQQSRGSGAMFLTINVEFRESSSTQTLMNAPFDIAVLFDITNADGNGFDPSIETIFPSGSSSFSITHNSSGNRLRFNNANPSAYDGTIRITDTIAILPNTGVFGFDPSTHNFSVSAL